MAETIITCENLDEAIDHYTKQLGYRLDMIKPADSPREALLSKDGEQIRLIQNNKPATNHEPPTTNQPEWIKGRAGMDYRDLIPDRLGGMVIASHIRLTEGGEVPDYVHYHKVEFQMIYCKRGRIRVVYEDQGEPFWLEKGDCVLQPPEIRHRVLECTAGAEVFEVSMPADHETWVEHEIELPTAQTNPDRDFNGQKFCKSEVFRPSELTPKGVTLTIRDLGIAEATDGHFNAYVQQLQPEEDLPANYANDSEISLYFRLDDAEMLAVELKLLAK